MIEYLGYIAALLIGLVLGLTGGGGAILTVPVLVYLMGLNPIMATSYSLFIVGTTSAFGTFQNFKKGLVDIKSGLLFAIPSVIAIFLTRKFIVPNLPEILFQNENFILSRNTFLMVLFAVVMLFASLSMLKTKKNTAEIPVPQKHHPTVVILRIFSVGILIGLIGAGGGFLIVPALIYIVRLPIRKAIGTSLLIISINSLIGFTGDIGHVSMDWFFLFSFSILAIIGIFIGIYFSQFIRESRLKKGFGWFVLIMAFVIFIKELFF